MIKQNMSTQSLDNNFDLNGFFIRFYCVIFLKCSSVAQLFN